MPEPNARSLRAILQRRKLPGLILFDARGKLLFWNSVAQQILHHQNDQEKFLQKIRKTIRNLSNKTRASPPSSARPAAGPLLQATFPFGRSPYLLRAFLLHYQTRGRPPLIAVLFEQISPSRVDFRKAQGLFGLSPREIEAIQALHNGMTDKEIASAMAITPETVRGYLKTIRAKLGVSTRTAILQKVLSL